MNGWKTAPLEELCDVTAGGTPSRANPTYFGGGIPWVKIGDMLQDRVTSTEETISQAGLDNSAAKLLPSGTVLISIFATIGRTAVLEVEAATNQAIAGVIPRDTETLTPEYLRRYFDNVVMTLERRARGVAQVNINSGILKSLKIPLPPLAEQRRIAEVLDRADALRAKLREALAQLDALNQAIFLDMFGDPATNPMEWPCKPVGELASKFSDGPFGSNLKSSHYTETGVRVIRLQNIGVGEFVDDDKAYISEHHFAYLKKHECRPGDVLIGTLGDPNLRACVQPEWLLVALNKADCVQFRPDERVATAPYICALLNQPATERTAQALMLGQTRIRISMGRLRGLKVPVPSIELQHEFAHRIATVERLKAAHRASLAKMDSLFAALQHRAFRGEL